nr:protein farnesyltransferase subunit beta-like [Lytechinus pictus]
MAGDFELLCNSSLESDDSGIRGAYCAAVSALLTNVATPDMFDGTPEWIVSCQTYEGGFAGQPGMEAHGGYTFCSVAALVLLGHERLCDVQGLLRWLAMRQMRFEGGFQGRTNKLVDGCYSFWQAGVFPLIHSILSKQDDTALSMDSWMFDQRALQEYVLLCCQYNHGGLIDKPGKARDFYHTCYCLSGLSVAQHFLAGQLREDDVAGDPKNELVSLNYGAVSYLAVCKLCAT